MISHFFIDRPIFASVVSIVIVLTGAIAAFSLPIAQYPQITPPAIQVSISYPGANAQVVADTVGAPIEQQVNGVQGMLYMSSQMGNDGAYALTVTFDIGTDLNTALVMVQNRVSLAMPQLPNFSPEPGNYDPEEDARYPDGREFLLAAGSLRQHLFSQATLRRSIIKDEMHGSEGVSDIVTYLGQRDYSIRAWLDPQKLAACNMTAMDVAAAIQSQNLDAPIGQVGQPTAPPGQMFQLPLNTLGRLVEPEQFGDIIVKDRRHREICRSTSTPAPPAPQAENGFQIDRVPTVTPTPLLNRTRCPTSCARPLKIRRRQMRQRRRAQLQTLQPFTSTADILCDSSATTKPGTTMRVVIVNGAAASTAEGLRWKAAAQPAVARAEPGRCFDYGQQQRLRGGGGTTGGGGQVASGPISGLSVEHQHIRQQL